MPKIQYKEIKFQQKSLDLIELVNQVVEEYQAQGYELTLRQHIISWLHVVTFRTMNAVIRTLAVLSMMADLPD